MSSYGYLDKTSQQSDREAELTSHYPCTPLYLFNFAPQVCIPLQDGKRNEKSEG